MIIRKPNKLLLQLGSALILAAFFTCTAPAQEEDTDPSPTEEVDSASDTTDDAATTAEDATTADDDTATPDTPSADDTSADDAAPATPAKKSNPRRAANFAEALEAAGDDGIAVYCYGPDWNRRSVRMLKEFWETPEVEQATGGAILVAVPYYEYPTQEQEDQSMTAASGMKAPPFGVCPTVMMFDKNGDMYANLFGTDNLGDEDHPEIGLNNLKAKLAALRRRNELTAQAESSTGVAKAKLLNEIAELPIIAPRGLVEKIKEADPADSSGMVRRNTFKARDFLYEQMDTKDGFLSPDFVPDYAKMQEACMKVIKDEALRPIDRQAAYLLLIGQSRREEITGQKMKVMITACSKLAPDTVYGRLGPVLTNTWATIRVTHTKEQRRDKRAKEREAAKDRKAKDKDEKRAARNTEIR